MKSVTKKLMLFIVSICMVLGVVSPDSKLAAAPGDRYIAWTHTMVSPSDSYDEAIDLIPEGGDVYNPEQASVVYCFNYDRQTPPKTKDNLPFPKYEEVEGNPQNFADYAESEVLSGQQLYDAVLKVIYNGYPNNAADLQGTLSEARFRAVTQYAIWYLTDAASAKFQEFQKQIPQGEKAVIDILLGKVPGAKDVPADAKLSIFRDTAEVQNGGKPYQHLLSAKFSNYPEVKPSVDIYAKKQWDKVAQTDSLPAVSFRLVDKLTNLQIGEVKQLVTQAGAMTSETVHWDNIPGRRIDYKVEEVSVPTGFESNNQVNGSGTVNDPYVITNSKKSTGIQYVQNVTVRKVWDKEPAGYDQTQRPAVYFTLFRSVNGKEEMMTKDILPSLTANPQKLTSTNSITWNQLYAPTHEGNENGAQIDYYVKETDENGQPIQSVSYDVSSSILGVTTAGAVSAKITVMSPDITFTNTYHDIFHRVLFSKRDENGAGLQGAKVRVLDSKNELVGEWESTKDAQALNLKPGQFTFEEISAPAGYETAEKIIFTVNADGSVESQGKQLDQNTVVMVDASKKAATTTTTTTQAAATTTTTTAKDETTATTTQAAATTTTTTAKTSATTTTTQAAATTTTAQDKTTATTTQAAATSTTAKAIATTTTAKAAATTTTTAQDKTTATTTQTATTTTKAAETSEIKASESSVQVTGSSEQKENHHSSSQTSAKTSTADVAKTGENLAGTIGAVLLVALGLVLIIFKKKEIE